VSLENLTPEPLALDIYVVLHRNKDSPRMNLFLSKNTAIECAIQVIREVIQERADEACLDVSRLRYLTKEPATYEAALYYYNTHYCVSENPTLTVYCCPLQHDPYPHDRAFWPVLP